MKKICPPPAPSGNTNPSSALPPEYLQSAGHTLGKRSNRPGKLTKALSHGHKGTPLVHKPFIQSPCAGQPGVRNTPNPQQGRPPFTATIIKPLSPRGIGVYAFRNVPNNRWDLYFTIFNLTGPLTDVRYLYNIGLSWNPMTWASVVGPADGIIGTAAIWIGNDARNREWLKYFSNVVARSVLPGRPYTKSHAGAVLSFEVDTS